MNITLPIAPLLLLALVTSLAGLGGAILLSHAIAVHNRRITRLEDIAAKEEAHRLALESISGLKKHYTYNTVAALADAIAVVLDSQADLQAAQARNQTVLGILGSLKTDPSAYNPDRPAGERKVDNRK